MKKHFVSVLIGILSLAGLLSKGLLLPEQNDINPVEIEASDTEQIQDTVTDEDSIIENSSQPMESVEERASTEELVINDDSIEEETETVREETLESTEVEKETVKEVVTEETSPAPTKKQESKKEDVKVQESKNNEKPQEKETATKKVEKTLNANSKEEINSLYNELSNCGDGTIFSKVIVNGKEYKKSDANDILKDLISRYGIDLQEQNNQTPPQSSNSSYASEVLSLVNKERANAGLSALSTNSNLTAAANRRAVEIVQSFSHTRPDGRSFSTVFDEFSIRPMAGGENIAYGQRSPSEVVNAWMNSPGHRANILNSNFNQLGVGVHQQNGTIYWTQLFTD